jgi:NAD-dependent dihydropyrimidine dehydrogenase PreA subunit
MTETASPDARELRIGDRLALEAERLGELIQALASRGYEVLGPRVRDGQIGLGRIASVDDLPRGVGASQSPGRYRLERRLDGAFFGWAVGAHGWRQRLQPQRQPLLEGERAGGKITFKAVEPAWPRQAFLGVKACDLAAIHIQDTVLNDATFADPHYQSRRAGLFIVAVACHAPAETCFCASMRTGPRPRHGFDLALAELVSPGRHRFVLEVGSAAGALVAHELSLARAGAEDLRLAEAAGEAAARGQARALGPDVPDLLARNLDSGAYEAVAERCLSCTSCTLVCPTCFCTSVYDATDLTGERALRTRRWDSCFALRHSYIHGGPVRPSAAARYRQWIMHKLSTWREQYGTSGCVGCGRCITWCPAQIDLTAVVADVRRREAETEAGRSAS